LEKASQDIQWRYGLTFCAAQVDIKLSIWEIVLQLVGNMNR
jgi:hypothetical protein